MNIYSIYKATNLINNKVYIGFAYTKKDLSSINNPMKDPIKVAKMLETRKRNKELKALNG
jgi:hypothetical protein